jgi:hypothetical protein
VSALTHYRRAATYFATALYAIDGSSLIDQRDALWQSQRSAWEHVVDLSPVPGERLEIPYEGATLPAYFFRAKDAQPGEARPLVVVNNGSDGATSQMWAYAGAAAEERGYHWMTFDGPGQQSMLFERGVPFRPDWEAVLTPVYDAMTDRPDVDGQRVAVIGISQAGYWVPRAIAFEHRFAAAIVDPGVVDVSASWLEPLPKGMRRKLDEGNKESFDREMHLSEKISKKVKSTLDFRGAPYGLQSDSRFDLYKTVREYRLGDEVEQISTPLLITSPEGEQFWPGQSQQLYERLNSPKTLIEFTAAEGADRHCEPLGSALREARMFDWLDGYLGAA